MHSAWWAALALAAADGGPAKPAPRWSLPGWFERLREPATWSLRPRPAGPSDAVLKLRCQDALFADRTLRASGLDVEVAGGTATLRGTAPSLDDVRRAERLVRAVRDLRGVRNELRSANPYDAARLPAEATLAGEPKPLPPPPPRVVPNAPPAPPTAAPVSGLALSKPRRLRAPALASNRTPDAAALAVAAPNAALAAPGFASPHGAPEAGAIVGRPISVLVSPELPRVVEYTIRRLAPPVAPAPVASAFVEPLPRRRPSLIKPSADAPPLTAVAAIAEAAPAEPPRDEAEAILREDPAAARLRVRRSGSELVLSGAAPDAATVFRIADALGALPGVGAVTVDQTELTLDRRD